ncbi:MAG TPA: GNAT family N-acetyltransferase [Magnetospirillum sp.]|jgi:predicted N-acetyltransferase YhbS|nr:GNAT family N-acetyltransferase [Magnetospirillum sp.]
MDVTGIQDLVSLGGLVRPLAVADIGTVTAIVAAAFREADGTLPERYRPSAVAERLASGLGSRRATRSRFLVAELDGEPVAVGGFSRESWCSCAWSLYMAAVRPDLQGRRLGSLLIQRRLDAIAAEHCGPGTVVVSSRHPGSFLRLGFQALRRMPHGPTLMVREFEGTAASVTP